MKKAGYNMPSDRIARLVGGALAGGVIVYFFDSYRGKLRRSRLGDQGRHLAALVRNAPSSRPLKRCLSLSGRGLGLLAGLRTMCTPEEVADDILVDRVRAKLGHVSPHMGQIQVSVHEGVVTLHGSLPKVEREPLVSTASKVPGVRGVVEQLGE